jgi:hypothetical protein
MKKISGFLLIMFALCGWTDPVSALQPPGLAEAIASSIKAGNSRELAKYFGPTVEVITPGSEGAFSKSQAEVIMKDFFTRSVPVSFVINQKGNSSGGSQFLIGTYRSKTETLNVYILLKPVSGQLLIQQLHFETD